MSKILAITKFRLGMISLLILILYVFTHLVNLTSLPVFADESIYIRWSQLIIDDWQQYLFFAMNDGKTPLQIWLMAPLQFAFSDQLFAGRFLVVMFGLFQVILNGIIVSNLGGRKKTVWLTMLLTTILPFWYFHHRIALLDGQMTFFMSLSVLGAIKIAQNPTNSNLKSSLLNKKVMIPILLTGLSLGLAIITKLPAVLIIPSLFLFALLPAKANFSKRLLLVVQLGLSVLIGLVVFFSLKIHPAFGQLFNRGSDFLYPWQEVVLNGVWQTTIKNIPNYLAYFAAYLTLPILALSILGLFSKKHQRVHHVLFWSAVLFAGPIMLLGLVVYPRYLFPASLFITISAGLSVQDIIDTHISKRKNLTTRTIMSLALVLFIANTIATSGVFIYQSLFDTDKTPLVTSDKTQYLYEWSSGHGIKETVEFIKEEAKDKRVSVATEGYFGTLPDALLMYLHRQDVSNIFVEGIGYPIKEITPEHAQKTQDADLKLLVVNSHRMELSDPEIKLLAEFCRPDDAPCLQIWDITTYQLPPSSDNQNP